METPFKNPGYAPVQVCICAYAMWPCTLIAAFWQWHWPYVFCKFHIIPVLKLKIELVTFLVDSKLTSYLIDLVTLQYCSRWNMWDYYSVHVKYVSLIEICVLSVVVELLDSSTHGLLGRTCDSGYIPATQQCRHWVQNKR